MASKQDTIRREMQGLLRNFELVEWELTNMPNLTLDTLDLDRNDLDHIPTVLAEIEYYAFRVVQAVSFNDNPRIGEAAMLGKLEDLQVINMWHCGLKQIPAEWNSLHKLKVLGLGNNPGLQGFGALKNLINITWLDLGACGLLTLPVDVTHLTNLVVLALGENKGIFIDDTICCFWNLQRLALNDCDLKTVPSAVYFLKKLTHLYLDNNMLDTISEEISKLKQLKELSVVGNKHIDIPKLLGRCESIKSILIDDTYNVTNASNSLRRKLQVISADSQQTVDQGYQELETLPKAPSTFQIKVIAPE